MSSTLNVFFCPRPSSKSTWIFISLVKLKQNRAFLMYLLSHSLLLILGSVHCSFPRHVTIFAILCKLTVKRELLLHYPMYVEYVENIIRTWWSCFKYHLCIEKKFKTFLLILLFSRNSFTVRLSGLIWRNEGRNFQN